MAGKKRADDKVEGEREVVAVPTWRGDEPPKFVLRADQPGHLRALVAALGELNMGSEGGQQIREFELWAEAHR